LSHFYWLYGDTKLSLLNLLLFIIRCNFAALSQSSRKEKCWDEFQFNFKWTVKKTNVLVV